MVAEEARRPAPWGLLIVAVALGALWLVTRDRERIPPVIPAASPTHVVLEALAAALPEDTAATLERRRVHVTRYIEARGVEDRAVLDAMRQVPRHAFVPERLRPLAYEDRPLPIGEDQTISQPYVVASMTEEARIQAGDKVLEIGTGSGYQAAVLAAITPHVFSIEIKEPLARRAASTLLGAGYDTVQVAHADGYYGWPSEAPFDAILVTAAAPHVPPPLVQQLKKGGRMVIPVGSPFAVQDLVLVTKDDAGAVRTKSLYQVRFVPLTGSLGQARE